MQTDFLLKKWFVYAVAMCMLFLSFGALYRFYPQAVDVAIEFHFLVAEDKSVEAGAEFIKLEGGAGYLLSRNGKDYAVLSVYLQEEDGLAVQEVLSAQSRATQLISMRVNKLYFRGKKERLAMGLYTGALQSFYDCLTILEESIARLEKGLPQEKMKGILFEIKNQLLFMSEIYANNYKDFSVFCSRMVSNLETKCNNILYVGELRYFLCEAVEEYLDFTREFL